MSIFSELRQAILRQLTRRKEIYLFGTSGSGKSQFINSMQNSIDIPEKTMHTKSIDIDLKNFFIRFKDTPGHDNAPDRKKAYQNIIKNNAEGIIHFVTYGYDERNDADKSVALDHFGNINEAFLASNRMQEIQRLREWSTIISEQNEAKKSKGSVKWILLIVNKADVWWDKKEIVEQHYSEYVEELEKLGIQVRLYLYCGIIRSFFKTKQSNRFGENDKTRLHDRLIKELLYLLNQ
jgi:ABC-type dipeptide/oligopeptide/nickel transport system ATPase component